MIDQLATVLGLVGVIRAVVCDLNDLGSVVVSLLFARAGVLVTEGLVAIQLSG